MLCGEAIGDLVTLLERREACLWHACNFQDFCAYLMLGGVPSRAVLEQSGLRYTGFTTDDADHANGVWDKVFVNLSDFGEGFARGSNAVPNPYGPIVLQIRPAALVDAEDVAVCLYSAGARDFDREAEALPRIELVDQLFFWPLGSVFPDSTRVRFSDELRAVFPQAKSRNPELSCTFLSGRISLDHVVVVWTDPYVIGGKALRDWVQEAAQWRGLESLIRERTCKDGSRRRLYGELADLVSQGYRSLATLERLESTSDAMRNWAGKTLENSIDYNFRRYADYLFNGTLQPIAMGSFFGMVAPQGSYTEKLSRLLALKHEPSPFAIAEMVATLEDEDERIRWIAGSALLSRKDERVSTMLTTFIKQTQSSAARASA